MRILSFIIIGACLTISDLTAGEWRLVKTPTSFNFTPNFDPRNTVGPAFFTINFLFAPVAHAEIELMVMTEDIGQFGGLSINFEQRTKYKFTWHTDCNPPSKDPPQTMPTTQSLAALTESNITHVPVLGNSHAEDDPSIGIVGPTSNVTIGTPVQAHPHCNIRLTEINPLVFRNCSDPATAVPAVTLAPGPGVPTSPASYAIKGHGSPGVESSNFATAHQFIKLDPDP